MQGAMVVGVHAQQLQGHRWPVRTQGKDQRWVGLCVQQLQAHTGSPCRGLWWGARELLAAAAGTQGQTLVGQLLNSLQATVH